jgi:hypothetical protein
MNGLKRFAFLSEVALELELGADHDDRRPVVDALSRRFWRKRPASLRVSERLQRRLLALENLAFRPLSKSVHRLLSMRFVPARRCRAFSHELSGCSG